jgi:hypothetical protein
MTRLTLKNLKQNKIVGFDCGKVDDEIPYWEVQYLGDGMMGIYDLIKGFDTPQQALQWIKEWEELAND